MELPTATETKLPAVVVVYPSQSSHKSGRVVYIYASVWVGCEFQSVLLRESFFVLRSTQTDRGGHEQNDFFAKTENEVL